VLARFLPDQTGGLIVEEYLNSVGLGYGNAWCAAFVYWYFDQACAKLNREYPLVITAGCMEHWRNTNGVIPFNSSNAAVALLV